MPHAEYYNEKEKSSLVVSGLLTPLLRGGLLCKKLTSAVKGTIGAGAGTTSAGEVRTTGVAVTKCFKCFFFGPVT